MLSLAQLAQILLLLATLVTAVPVLEDLAKSGGFTLRQVRKENYTFNAAMSIYRTHMKYHWPISESLKLAVLKTGRVTRRADGTVAASPIDSSDSAYTVTVGIGTPAQSVNLDVDSGSSDFWVFSTLTPTGQDGHDLYDPSQSSTAHKDKGQTWQIQYGDSSSSSGVVYTDVVSVGQLSVPNQAIEVATQVSSEFAQDKSVSGLFGVAFSQLNTVTPSQALTFFDNVKASLDSPVFCADLRNSGPGSYDFGQIDSSKYTGQIEYVPVDSSQGFWSFTATGYAVGKGDLNQEQITGIADTGTTLLYLPSDVVQAYYSQVQGADQSGNIPCDATLPDFSFGVGNTKITIPGSYIALGGGSDGGQCQGGLQVSDGNGNIFGDLALRAAFVVFDGSDPPKLGWANKPLS